MDDIERTTMQCLHFQEQAIAMFRDQYLCLDNKRRKAFKRWINYLATPFREGLAGYMKMQRNFTSGSCYIGADVELHNAESGREASLSPKILRKAIRAWDRGAEYVHRGQ